MTYQFLFDLEIKISNPKIRLPRIELENILAADFFEYGTSGKIWGRAAIIEELLVVRDYSVEALDFAAHELAEGVVLVTYKTFNGTISSLRSSIWKINGRQWQLFFHQGTKLPAPPA